MLSQIFFQEHFLKVGRTHQTISLLIYMHYMARVARLDIRRIKVVFPPRIYGESHWNNGTIKAKWKFIKRTLNFSKVLKKEGIN